MLSTETITWDRLHLDLGTLIGRPIAIVFLVVLALVIRWICAKVIDRVVARAVDGVLPDRFATVSAPRRAQRAKTMGGLLKSIVTGVVVAVFGTMILDQCGVNIAPIIASAGIVGLAVGFGAQSLVKDFLSGVFMLMEDQYGVGDVIDAGVATGTVEAVSLRVPRLRDLDGTVWYVPNGTILKVGNKSQNWSRAVVDVGIGYGEDLAHVQEVLRDVAHRLWQDQRYQSIITEEPQVTGVEAMTTEAITVRVLVKTVPLKQWEVARELRQRIKARFDREGISMPIAQRVFFPQQPTTVPASSSDEAGTGS